MDRSSTRTLTLVILGALVICGVAAGVGAWQVYQKDPTAPARTLAQYFTMGWFAWDAGWYKLIAEQGYFYIPGRQSPVAFFPLYPLAISTLLRLGIPTHTAGILITMLCGPLALVLVARWARTRVDESTALQAGLLIALYPLSFYLYGAMYSDGLFLLLIVGAFLCLERDRLVLAVVLGAIATAARPVAPAVVLGLLVRRLEWKRERNEPWTPRDFLPVLSCLGFVSYLLFLDWRFGNAFAFVETQGSPGWEQAPGWNTWLKFYWYDTVFGPDTPLDVSIRLAIHALLTVGALLLVRPTARLLGWGYALFVLAMVGLPAWSTKDFMGMGRYLISAFPLFLTAAMLLRERPRLRKGLIAASATSLVLLSLAFGMEQYIS
jgi:Gpi18-like mannosyltransferase